MSDVGLNRHHRVRLHLKSFINPVTAVRPTEPPGL